MLTTVHLQGVRCFARLRPLLAALIVLASLFCWSPPASAQSAADRATARSLAREGFEALKQGDFETAEDRFRRADALVHAPTLVVDHARSLVGLGRLVEAHERYSLVIREGVGPSASGPWKRAFEDAETEIEQLKGRLAWLTVKVVGPQEPEVTVDGKAIPSAAIGVRRATDPGSRTIVAGGHGYLPKEETVNLGEGEEQVLEIELDVDPNAATEQAQAPQRAPASEPVSVDTGAQDYKMLTYVALGVGGAGIIAGSVTGLLFLRKRSQLNKECVDGKCEDPRSEDKIETYRTLGTISGISYGVGVAGVATGVTLWLLGHDSNDGVADSTSATLTPYFAGDTVGVQGRF